MRTTRPIIRGSFFAGAGVSAVLLLAALILWPVSYYRYMFASYETGGKACYVRAGSLGRVILGYDTKWPSSFGGLRYVNGKSTPGTEVDWSYLTWNAPDPNGSPGTTTTLGVGVTRFIVGSLPGHQQTGCAIPFSYLAVLFSILPLLALRLIRRRRGAARIGLCPKCGYDLRAQRDGAGGAVCPECGTPVAGRAD